MSFGIFGIILYYFVIIDPIISITIHVVLTSFTVYIFNRLFHAIFQESGILVKLTDLIGYKSIATTDISYDFGEVSVKTQMGYKRYLARPIFSNNNRIKYNRGEDLFIIGVMKKMALVSDINLKGINKNQAIKKQLIKLKI